MCPRRAALPHSFLALLLGGAGLTGPVEPTRAAAPAAPATPAAGTATSATAPQGPRPPIVIDAAFSRVDYQTNTVVFENVAVSQGDTRMKAERAHATGVGFEDSRWTFDGNVEIDIQPRGTLRADQAVVQFAHDRIAEATASGTPARFEQQRTASGSAAHGHADRIVYDAVRDTVRLSGDAWLADGRNAEINGPVLVYDIRNERLQAVSAGERRGVHIRITPESPPKSGEPPAGKAPGR